MRRKIISLMPELSKSLNFEKVNNEKRWTYSLKIIFNYKTINKLTITSYYQTKPGREMITNELILEMMKEKLHKQALKPTNYQGSRKVYKWEELHNGRKYRFIFWFKDNETSHLWIRNHYLINFRLKVISHLHCCFIDFWKESRF